MTHRRRRRSAAGLSVAAVDPYFSNVKSLLHLDGANNSTTITDQTGKAWTANGGAKIVTAQSKFGGASLVVVGAGDWISTPDSTDFTLGTSDFTIEGWVRFASLNTGNDNGIVAQVGAAGTNASSSFSVIKTAANKINVYCLSGSSVIGSVTSTTTATTGVDYFFQYTRSGSTFTLGINGLSEGTASSAASVNDSAGALTIGRLGDFTGTSWYMNGWIDDFRFTKGTARAIALPTAAFPNS